MSESLAHTCHPASATATTMGGWFYLGRTVVHPAGVMSFVVGVCLGTWLGGALGLVFGLLGGLALIATASHCSFFRGLLDEHIAERERRRRDLDRERRLERAAPFRQAEFAELCTLVGEVENRDPAQARRFELQELLDHYVNLSTTHQRLMEALTRADRVPLWEAANSVRPGAHTSDTTRQRKDILSRRLRHRDECRTRAAGLAEELDAVSEFIHLVSEVTSCPPVEGENPRELERRIWELEAQESALRQLSAA